MYEQAGLKGLIEPSWETSKNVRPQYVKGKVLNVREARAIDLNDFKKWVKEQDEYVFPDEIRLIDDHIQANGTRGSYVELQDYLGGRGSTDKINRYLQNRGFAGVEYAGGAQTGNIGHRAFVVFDPANVISEYSPKLYLDDDLVQYMSHVKAGTAAPPNLPVPHEARLKPLHDALVGNDLPRLSRIARKLVNSRLGVPSETDAWIEDAIFNFMRRNPAKYREATRLVLDMQYSGALGLNPAKAARNSFQSLLTATGVGPGHMAMGMREVARREKTITAMAEKYGALKSPSIDAFNTAKITGHTPMRRMWNHYVKSAFELFHAADRRNRLWAFAAGQRRALIEYDEIVAKGADAPALQIFRPEQRQRFAAWAADPSITRDELAGRYGAALSDLTQWVYGKRGSPLATRNVLGANLGIFTSWPANYISLMYEWAANGQIGKIINLSLGAAILDRVGEEAGVGRMTGFTSDQEGVLKVLPTGPIPDRMPGVGSPTMELIPQAARLGKEAFKGLTGGEPDFNPYRYHSLTLPAQPLIRLGQAGLADDPEVTMRRLTGISQPKDR